VRGRGPCVPHKLAWTGRGLSAGLLGGGDRRGRRLADGAGAFGTELVTMFPLSAQPVVGTRSGDSHTSQLHFPLVRLYWSGLWY